MSCEQRALSVHDPLAHCSPLDAHQQSKLRSLP